MGETLTQRRRVRDEALRGVNRFCGGRWWRYPTNKPRLITCPQPRWDVRGERYSESLGVKDTQAAIQVKC